MKTLYDEWQDFKKKGDNECRNSLVVRYLPLAKYIASTFPKSNPGLYSYDDIVGWACIGLIDAVEKFDPDRGLKFETYAISRIRGEVIDNLRRLSSSYYSRRKAILDKEYEALHLKLGRPPDDYEMAERLEIDVEKYRDMLTRLLPVYIVSLDEVIDMEGHFQSVYEATVAKRDFASVLEIREKKDALSKVIHSLPKKERLIVILYHYEGLTMKEIAEILDLSQGRISQLHTRALLHLKSELKKMEDVFDNRSRETK